MIESVFGKIDISEDDVGYTVDLRFNSQFSDDPTYLTTLDERNLDRMIYQLSRIKDSFKRIKERRKQIIYNTDINRIYNDMDQKYNKYPIMMSNADAFGHALADGIIDEETYNAIREYCGKLWNYVGD